MKAFEPMSFLDPCHRLVDLLFLETFKASGWVVLGVLVECFGAE
jgi:hypothetical protein